LTGTVTNAQIAAMAASKLTGALPAIDGSNLTGVASDISNLNANVALNFFLDAIDHARSIQNVQDGWTDQFEDQTGVDDDNSVGETYDASNDLYKPTLGSTVPMVSFDGTNDTLSISTGEVVNGKDYTLSFWVKRAGSGATNEKIIESASGRFSFKFDGSDRVSIILKNTSASIIANVTSTNTVQASDGLTHILIGINMGNSTQGDRIKIYIDDVKETIINGTAPVDDTVDSTDGSMDIGANNGLSEIYEGELGQLYIVEVYQDPDTLSNRRKFNDGNGNPVELGSTGSTPTGTAPRIFLNNTTATWQNNLGLGGNFTETGALTNGTDITTTPDNMTLMAEPVVALAAPAKAHVTLFKQDVDSVTLNTDLLAWVSRSKQTITSDFGTDEKLDATAHGLVNTDRVMFSLAGAVSGASPAVPMVVFDGTNDFISLSADLTGNADGDRGIISCWVNFASGGDGELQRMLASTGSYLTFAKTGANKIDVYINDSGNANRLNIQTTTAYTGSSGLLHVLFSWDVANNLAHCYINDVANLTTLVNSSTNTLDYTRDSWRIGASQGAGNQKFNGEIGQLYFNPVAYLDFSVESNRRLFVTAGIKPVDLGAAGATPTGTAPLIFMNNTLATWETNLGTGGGFTETGSITAGTDIAAGTPTSLPVGLDNETVYYVVNKTTNDFEVSLTSGGSAVNITGDGGGTRSVHAVTAVTLVDEGTYSSYDIIAASVDISAQPSDTDMVLFVQSKNGKDMKIHGQALQWED